MTNPNKEPYMSLHNGSIFFYEAVKSNPQVLDLNTIAVSLSRINRFVGHTSRPLSVLEHSLWVAEATKRIFCIKDKKDDNGIVRTALMHDAVECVTGDIPRSRKLYPDKKYEELILNKLAEIYNFFPTINKDIWRVINHVDDLILGIEGRDLFPSSNNNWIKYYPSPPHWLGFSMDLEYRHEVFGDMGCESEMIKRFKEYFDSTVPVEEGMK